MKIKKTDLIIYLFAFSSMVIFFLFMMSIFSLLVPLTIMLGLTVTMYFINSFTSKVETKFQYICDIIIFFSLFFIILSGIREFLVYSIASVLFSAFLTPFIYVELIVLFIIAFAKRIGDSKGIQELIEKTQDSSFDDENL